MNTDKRVSTGTRLKQIMSERGLKQVDILKASEPYQKKFNVQLKKSTLSQYVNDKQSPDDNRIYLLSQTLGVSEPWLMGFDVSKENHIKKQMNLESEISNIVRRLDPLKQRKVKNYANSQLYMQLNNSISEKNTSIPVVHNSSVAANPTELSYEDTELHDEGFERIRPVRSFERPENFRVESSGRPGLPGLAKPGGSLPCAPGAGRGTSAVVGAQTCQRSQLGKISGEKGLC